MAQSEGETVKAPGQQPRQATPERLVTSGTAHPRKRMAEMPIIRIIRVVPWNFRP